MANRGDILTVLVHCKGILQGSLTFLNKNNSLQVGQSLDTSRKSLSDTRGRAIKILGPAILKVQHTNEPLRFCSLTLKDSIMIFCLQTFLRLVTALVYAAKVSFHLHITHFLSALSMSNCRVADTKYPTTQCLQQVPPRPQKFILTNAFGLVIDTFINLTIHLMQLGNVFFMNVNLTKTL